MKKRVLAFLLVFCMVITLVPVSVVQAADSENVTKGKGYVDEIIAISPTVEEYKEEIADTVDSLGTLLESISDEEEAVLDTYVAEVTVVTTGDAVSGGAVTGASLLSDTTEIGMPRYTTVVDFYVDYRNAQDEYFKEEGEKLTAVLQGILDNALERESFEKAVEYYTTSSWRVKDLVDDELENSINQLRELMILADKADDVITPIKKFSNETTYLAFDANMTSAQTALDAYYSKFTDLKRYAKYANCLIKARRDDVITTIDKYNEYTLYWNVEKAYEAVGVFNKIDDDVQEKVVALKEAIQTASDSDYNISIFDFFNGEEMYDLIATHDRIVVLEDMLANTPDEPKDTTELAAVLRAYDYYLETLTADEQNMVPEEWIEKMNHAAMISTGSDEVMEAIEAIDYAASEEDYADFVSSYENAYLRYQKFMNNYQSVSGVDNLINNKSALDSATLVLEMIKSIKDIVAEEDATVCTEYIKLKAINVNYEKLTDEQKAKVYNYSELLVVNQEVENALSIRQQIQALQVFDLKDEAKLLALRETYNNLSDTTKSYVGELHESMLIYAEEQMEALNKNKAQVVVDKISSIGTVSVSDKEAVKIARTLYNALTSRQKVYVTNLGDLVQAEEIMKTLDFSMKKATIFMGTTYTYAGVAVTPEPIIRLNDTTLVLGVDYTLTYINNKNKGTAKVTITGKGFYEDSVVKTFTIKGKHLAGASIKGLKKSYAMNPKGVKPNVKVKYDNITLTKGKDYKLVYKANKKCGTATVIVKGKGNFRGKLVEEFTIKQASIKKAKVTNYKKNLSKMKVKFKGVTLKKNEDYKVSVKKKVVTIIGIGNYKGTKKIQL